MKELIKVCKALKIEINAEQEEKFLKYMESILEWNEKVNLTAIKDRDEFIKKHYIDSIVIGAFKEFKEAKNIIDVGTGGGFPGVPLAILFPEKEFVLIDSLNKRIKIINEVCEELNIKNVRAIHSRAEDLARDKNHRDKYDICISRAVANLSTLAEYCLPFVKTDGWFLPYKTEKAAEEIKLAEKAIEVLCGETIENRSTNVEGYDSNHQIIFIKKIKRTGKNYPR